MIDVYNQSLLAEADNTARTKAKRNISLLNMKKLDNDGFKSLMIKNELDASIIPEYGFSAVLAIGGHPGIVVPSGYKDDGMLIGISFSKLRGSEPKLIEIAYGFEQIILIRKPPPSIIFDKVRV
ncbi:probable amidase At4g34880 [Papaver somniferum]|uniref:probable amidase At4g34880 n=1 Tax=Papaver somniferum TaxID=3469 RepID=UPI000E6F46C0|nr:probable amidase At4g34880 [Papaver somniferum]